MQQPRPVNANSAKRRRDQINDHSRNAAHKTPHRKDAELSDTLEITIARWRVRTARESYNQTAAVLETAVRENWPEEARDGLANAVNETQEALRAHKQHLMNLRQATHNHPPSGRGRI